MLHFLFVCLHWSDIARPARYELLNQSDNSEQLDRFDNYINQFDDYVYLFVFIIGALIGELASGHMQLPKCMLSIIRTSGTVPDWH